MTDDKNDVQMSLPELLRQAIRESGGTIPDDDQASSTNIPSGPPNLRIVKDDEEPPAN